MTDKQKRAIKFIEQMLEIKYTGMTDKEAYEFIGTNLRHAKKCAYFESNMSIPVFSAEMGRDEEPTLDLKRGLSREILIRDIQHGKNKDICMTNFAQNLYCENFGEVMK